VSGNRKKKYLKVRPDCRINQKEKKDRNQLAGVGGSCCWFFTYSREREKDRDAPLGVCKAAGGVAPPRLLRGSGGTRSLRVRVTLRPVALPVVHS